MHRMTAAMLLFAALVATVPAAAGQEAAPSAIPSIVTNGEAVVRRPPDEAYVTAAVETRGRAPRDVQQQNAAAMAAVLQRLTTAGVPKDAVRTLGYTVQQEVDYVNGRRVLKEFVARNAVEIRIAPVERSGEIIDAVVQAGATAVDRVRFDVTDRAALERETLRLAVVDARARADAAAAGAGRTVDRVLRIDDTRQPDYRGPALMSARAAAGDAATPIEPGVIEIRATVTLTVALK
jgi:uncharacterized protein YggE